MLYLICDAVLLFLLFIFLFPTCKRGQPNDKKYKNKEQKSLLIVVPSLKKENKSWVEKRSNQDGQSSFGVNRITFKNFPTKTRLSITTRHLLVHSYTKSHRSPYSLSCSGMHLGKAAYRRLDLSAPPIVRVICQAGLGVTADLSPRGWKYDLAPPLQ